jgi:UDP-N-acetylmuramate: L-alanyl-gamma-D-glutamyl-meso-diaminopimelate ligase
MGCWSNQIKINDNEIHLNYNKKEFSISNEIFSLESLPLIGEHNFKNYICAILAAKTGGINIKDSIESLKKFSGVKRRLEFKGEHNGIKIYDDFAHHPTAIKYTSDAVRKNFQSKKILGIVELGSNTMSAGYHGDSINESVKAFDDVVWLDQKKVIDDANSYDTLDKCLNGIKTIIRDYDVVILMTNKDSQSISQPIINFLNEK